MNPSDDCVLKLLVWRPVLYRLLGCLVDLFGRQEQTPRVAGQPLRRFLRGGRLAAYRRFLLSRPIPPTAFTAGRRFAPSARGWTNSSTGKLVRKLPDPHRTARALDKHRRRV